MSIFVVEDDAEEVAAFDGEPEGAEPAESVADGVEFEVVGRVRLRDGAVGAGEVAFALEEADRGDGSDLPHDVRWSRLMGLELG